MARETYKILQFIKRKPGMSVEDFRDHYERRHAPIGETYGETLYRYIRRYVNPQDHPETGPAGEMDFDVITELWFDDRKKFEDMLAYITTSVMPAEVVADEAMLFDRTSFRIATVTECESNLGGRGVDP